MPFTSFEGLARAGPAASPAAVAADERRKSRRLTGMERPRRGSPHGNRPARRCNGIVCPAGGFRPGSRRYIISAPPQPQPVPSSELRVPEDRMPRPSESEALLQEAVALLEADKVSEALPLLDRVLGL